MKEETLWRIPWYWERASLLLAGGREDVKMMYTWIVLASDVTKTVYTTPTHPPAVHSSIVLLHLKIIYNIGIMMTSFLLLFIAHTCRWSTLVLSLILGCLHTVTLVPSSLLLLCFICYGWHSACTQSQHLLGGAMNTKTQAFTCLILLL